MTFKTREEWLMALVREVKPIFSDVGWPIPDEVRVSCGFPGSRGPHTLGICVDRELSADKHSEIFITPHISDVHAVAATLVHELCHTIAGIEAHHGPDFKKIALAVGLQGRMRATHAGEELTAYLSAATQRLGPYPHSAIAHVVKEKKGSRMLKGVCPKETQHGYTLRLTKLWIGEGLPTCPKGHQMILDGVVQEEKK